jgi:Skp family chaperone for outer membrane proteins
MGLKDVLEKMKLVEVDPPAAERVPPPPAAPPAAARARPSPTAAGASVSIKEVLQKLPPEPRLDERALPKDDGDEIPDFAAVYHASGVKDPAHGFSAYKVLEILSSADFAALDARAKAAALSGFLRMNPSGPVPIADVIRDAVARDQALDNFEQFLRKKLDGRREQIDKENAALQSEIDELTRRNQEKMEVNRRALEKEKQRVAEWQARKRIEERKLFDAVGPFVEENPVSLGEAAEAPRAPHPGPPKR